jgi:molecular chaperone GrpE
VVKVTRIVTGNDETGKFTTEIEKDVIEAALKSVEKAEGASAGQAIDIDAVATAEAPAETASLVQLELEAARQQHAEAVAKATENHDKWLRALADLDNFKKRAAKEKEEVQRFGIERLLKDFLPVFDNFDRALEHAKGPNDFDSLKKGVEMMRKLMEDALSKNGVKAFSAKGQAFDPSLHEAMSSAESSDVPPNHVLSEVLRGFLLNERLVRPALVVVSKLPEKPPDGAASA